MLFKQGICKEKSAKLTKHEQSCILLKRKQQETFFSFYQI